MKVLHICASLDSRSGGTAEAVRCLGNALGALGVEQEIVSFASPDDQIVENLHVPSVQFDCVRVRGDGIMAKLTNWSMLPKSALLWIKENINKFDAVVVHGLWHRVNRLAVLALKRANIPYFVYPHGMLDPWFRKQYPFKHVAKQIIWLFNEGKLLNRSSSVLFTCEEERLQARQSFYPYHVRERVLAFGTTPPPPEVQGEYEAFLRLVPSLGNRPFLLFMSRIHPKKGCDLLVQAFSEVADEYPEIDLVIAGPDQVGQRRELEVIAEQTGVAERIHWPGMITGPAKFGALRNARAMILPSHQENFGIVVAEALACECPVLISNRVNIWREIENADAGLVADDSLMGTKSLLEGFLRLPHERHMEMGRAGRSLFYDRFTDRAAAADLYAVISDSIKRKASMDAYPHVSPLPPSRRL